MIDNSSPSSLLVLCDAPTLTADLERCEYFSKSHVMAVNLAGVKYEKRIDHWVSYHGEYFKNPGTQYAYAEYDDWMDKRKALGYNTNYIVHAPKSLGTVRCCHPYIYDGGGSGLYAVQVGLQHGYTHIIMLGCELQDDRHKCFQDGWRKWATELKDHVRAYSGFPAKLFPEPTDDWINKKLPVKQIKDPEKHINKTAPIQIKDKDTGRVVGIFHTVDMREHMRIGDFERIT